MVSKASDDLPDPLTPVTTVSLSRGISTSMLRRLFSRAPRIWMVVRMLGVEEIGRLLDPLEAALRQLERGGDFLQEPLALQPLARGLQVPRAYLREREVVAHLRQGDDAALLLKVVEQRLQVGPVMPVEVGVERVKRPGQNAPILALRQHVEVDRLEQLGRAFDRPVDDVLFPHLAPAD